MKARASELIRTLYGVPLLRQALIVGTGRRVRVRGHSMAPTLAPGEYVLFDTLAYRLGEPEVGDVVLASHPLRPGVRMIKRVGEVRTDGIWLVGDNDLRSTDSRVLGVYPRDRVLAKAWAVYWPAERVRIVE